MTEAMAATGAYCLQPGAVVDIAEAMLAEDSKLRLKVKQVIF